MPDYQALYTHLFNAVTDAIELLDASGSSAARARLIAAQQAAEESYIAGGDR